MNAMEHVRYLAEAIGARGSTTAKEAEAAAYAAQVLGQAGLAPVSESFSSARSQYHAYALWSGLTLLSVILFWAGGRWIAITALILGLLALLMALLELSFRPNALRYFLPKGQSQNVHSVIGPQGEQKQQVVLMGHLDSHRTPLVFSSAGWLKFFGWLVPLGLTSAVALLLLFLLGVLWPQPAWHPLTLPFAAVVLVTFLLMIQADLTPYTPGANDNATGAAVVLSLAEWLSREPLQHTAVWTVLSGCEEVGCYGAEAFAAGHRDALSDAIWITLDSVGGAGASVTYLTGETFLLTAKSDPGLLALADEIARERLDLDAYAQSFRGAFTEGAIAAKHGFRLLTLLSLRRDGRLPEWHRMTDVVERVDAAVVERTELFVWELLQRIDRGQG